MRNYRRMFAALLEIWRGAAILALQTCSYSRGTPADARYVGTGKRSRSVVRL
jgi:hypothetical protein